METTSSKQTETKNWRSQSLVERRETIEELLQRNKEKLLLALPKHLNAGKLIGTVLTSIARNPKLLECTQTSLLGAIWTAAQLGLSPDGLLGEGYLQPYKNKKRNVLECQFIPGYRGYIKLAYQSGKVKTFQSEAVYEKDAFEFHKGLEPKLVHVPARPPRGELIAVYTIVQLMNGGVIFDVMWREEIELIRLRAPGGNSDAWKNWPDEMSKKTGVRRMQKITPLSTELARAAGLDEKAEVLDESQQTDFALLEADLSPEITQEAKETIEADAASAEAEEIEKVADAAREKSDTAVAAAIKGARKNGNGKLKALQEQVSKCQDLVVAAQRGRDPEAEKTARENLRAAVEKVNGFLSKQQEVAQ